MAQIKETIELLTKILRHNGTSKIKPEIFRQAKFDKDEATSSMWKLLFEIIYYLKYRRIDDITIKAYSALSTDELCIYVKTEMKMRGFVSRSFHELSDDMSSGSRELLLAFGWLMCRSGLIDLFMEQCSTFLDGREVEGDLDKLALPRRKIAQLGSSSVNTAEVRDKISYLMWLNGKLRLSLRNVYTLQQQKSKLTQKVHELTRGLSADPSRRDHLTVLEVMMLKNPELLKRNLKLLEADNQRLESLIAWQHQDDLFWKWMESVLDAKVVDCGLIEEIDDKITPRTKATKLKLDSKLQLAESVKKYEAIVCELEKDLADQKSQRSTSIEDIDRALAEINLEIASHVRILLQRSSSGHTPSGHTPSLQCTSSDYTPSMSQQSSVSGVSDFRSEKEKIAPWTPVTKIRSLRRQQSRGSSIASAAGAEREISVMESELGQLQVLVERLQSDIEYKQSKYQEDLSSVTSGMDSLYEYISGEPVVFRHQGLPLQQQQ